MPPPGLQQHPLSSLQGSTAVPHTAGYYPPANAAAGPFYPAGNYYQQPAQGQAEPGPEQALARLAAQEDELRKQRHHLEAQATARRQ